MLADVDASKIRIETERMILRPFRTEDLADLYEYASVDGVGQMAGWKPHASVAESKFILDMFIRENKTLAIELKENQKVIGSIGLEAIDHDLDFDDRTGREIGYVLSKCYWGKGLMTEAVTAVIRFCFLELKMDWLSCGHFIWNHRSARVIQKAGFQFLKSVVRTTALDTQECMMLYMMHNPYK